MSTATSNPWVRKQTTDFRWHIWACSNETRLVYFSGSDIVLKKLGLHRIWIGWDISGIGEVSMLPRIIPIEVNSALASEDAIPLRSRVRAELRVCDEPTAIRAVALQAEVEQEAVNSRIAEALREICAQMSLRTIKASVASLPRKILACLASEKSNRELHLAILNVFVDDIAALNPEIDAAPEKEATFRAKAMLGELELQAAEAQRQGELQRDKERTEAERKIRREDARTDAEIKLEALNVTKERAALNGHFRGNLGNAPGTGRSDSSERTRS